MALKTLVKVGSITNLSDARYCAGMGVDFLGFRVVQGEANAMAAKTFQEIRGWIAGPQIVAELYGLRDRQQLESILTDFQPDFLEFSLDEWEFLAPAPPLPFMLSVKPSDELPAGMPKPSYLIVNVPDDSFSRFLPQNEILAAVASKHRLDESLTLTGVAGVCLTGGYEIRPGLKAEDDLPDILEALEVD